MCGKIRYSNNPSSGRLWLCHNRNVNGGDVCLHVRVFLPYLQVLEWCPIKGTLLAEHAQHTDAVSLILNF